MAKRQNTTIPDSLSVEQQNALELLMAGKSDSAVGEAVGVSRQTINEWKNQNRNFKIALQTARRELWSSQSDRLRALVGAALDVLCQDLQSDDLRLRQAAAVHTLKATGLYGSNLEPEGVEEYLLDEMIASSFSAR